MTAADIESRVRAYIAAEIPALGRSPSSILYPPSSPPAGAATPHVPPPTSPRLILAVSGGADSIAFAAILREAGIVDAAGVVVAHFDHRLRGEAAAARDRAVVEALCERYALRLVVGSWDAPVPGEAAAREARYRFLADTAIEANAGCVATGHTEDDQIETIVLNTLRGSGAYGQAGMLPDRPWPHAGDARVRALRLVRPLLALPRADTRAYCAVRGLAYVDDATNDDPVFARNRVRAMLADVDAETPDARALILRTAALARTSLATLEAAAARAVPLRDAEDGRAVALDRAPLRTMPPELSGYVWHRAVERLLGDTRDFGRRHYATLHAAAHARTGAVFELPRGVRLTVDADALLISVGTLGDPPLTAGVTYPVPFAGVLGAWYLELVPAPTGGAHTGPPETDWPDADGRAWEGELLLDLPAGAVLRARRPGDRIGLPGGRGHKKLHDAYIDARVPQRRRDAAPVLARGGDVIWTPLLAPRAGSDVAGAARLGRLRWRRAATAPPHTG